MIRDNDPTNDVEETLEEIQEEEAVERKSMNRGTVFLLLVTCLMLAAGYYYLVKMTSFD